MKDVIAFFEYMICFFNLRKVLENFAKIDKIGMINSNKKFGNLIKMKNLLLLILTFLIKS